jgi:hypothetical protein
MPGKSKKLRRGDMRVRTAQGEKEIDRRARRFIARPGHKRGRRLQRRERLRPNISAKRMQPRFQMMQPVHAPILLARIAEDPAEIMPEAPPHLSPFLHRMGRLRFSRHAKLPGKGVDPARILLPKRPVHRANRLRKTLLGDGACKNPVRQRGKRPIRLAARIIERETVFLRQHRAVPARIIDQRLALRRVIIGRRGHQHGCQLNIEALCQVLQKLGGKNRIGIVRLVKIKDFMRCARFPARFFGRGPSLHLSFFTDDTGCKKGRNDFPNAHERPLPGRNAVFFDRHNLLT